MTPEKPISSDVNFQDVAGVLERLNGQETAFQLDSLASQINQYYYSLTPQDILREREIYGLTEDFRLSRLPYTTSLVELHRQFREEKLPLEQQLELQDLFRQGDVFEPLIKKINQTLKDAPLEKAGSLMYLCYGIDNPFKGPSLEAQKITQQAYELFQTTYLETEVSPLSLVSITQMVDELVLTAISWKNAWAYFGPYRAKALLELLLSDNYGSKFFADLNYLADQRKLVCPPQLFCLLRQLTGDDIKHDDYLADLKAWYDSGKTLKDLIAANGLNYQITGLQRAMEYPLSEAKEWLSDETRQSVVLSLGGGVGVIELKRQKKWDLNGPIVIIDKNSQDESLTQALVLENELVFREGDPCLNQDQIQALWQDCSVALKFIQATLPLEPEEIRQHLHNVGIEDHQSIGIIFDQRASALYLHGEKLLSSIKTSLRLLADKGLYFLTKGYADKLFIDLVIKKGAEGIQPLLLHHTNSFFSSLTKGLLKLNTAPLSAESGTRRNRVLELIPFQEERLAKEFERQQQLQAIKLISKRFSERYITLWRSAEGFNYTENLVYAYAAYLGMPLFVPQDIPQNAIPYYTHLFNKLVEMITIAEENPALLENTDFYIADAPKEFEEFSQQLKYFFARVRKDPDTFCQSLDYLRELFARNCSPEAVWSQKLSSTTLELPPKKSILREAARKSFINGVRQEFENLFRNEFSLGDMGWYDQVVCDAIFDLYNLSSNPDENLGRLLHSAPPEKKEQIITAYLDILTQITRKLKSVNLGQNYEFDFSCQEEAGCFWGVTTVLSRVSNETWVAVNGFIDSHFDARSLQAVAGR